MAIVKCKDLTMFELILFFVCRNSFSISSKTKIYETSEYILNNFHYFSFGFLKRKILMKSSPVYVFDK